MQSKKQYRNEELLMRVGARIREIRTNAGYSQQHFANLCDLELSQINRIELGKINTSISQLSLIAEKLNVPITELLG